MFDVSIVPNPSFRRQGRKTSKSSALWDSGMAAGIPKLCSTMCCPRICVRSVGLARRGCRAQDPGPPVRPSHWFWHRLSPTRRGGATALPIKLTLPEFDKPFDLRNNTFRHARVPLEYSMGSYVKTCTTKPRIWSCSSLCKAQKEQFPRECSQFLHDFVRNPCRTHYVVKTAKAWARIFSG
jgi:hypothetical protein